jgi:lipoate synthase
MNVAAEVASWDIDDVVLTSVDRDDLPDGGAADFARTVQYVKQLRPQSTRVSSDQDAQQMPPTNRPLFVECLVSDFAGQRLLPLLQHSGAHSATEALAYVR